MDEIALIEAAGSAVVADESSRVNNDIPVLGSADTQGTSQTEPEGEVDGSDLEEDEDEEGQGDVTDTDEDYEQERQRQILQNQALLQSLGINSASSLSLGAGPSHSPSQRTIAPVPSSSRKRRKIDPTNTKAGRIVYDRAGYITSLPLAGTTHVVACISLPSDRRLSKRISDGEYQDCMSWAAGEDRRWRFGWGQGEGKGVPRGVPTELQTGEDEYVGGVGQDFRWRRWRGLERELRRELEKLQENEEMDHEGEEQGEDGKAPEGETAEEREIRAKEKGVSAYSLIPGAPCHQCRRKSEKPKMKCRNLNPECRAVFCETCCKRYSYFDFDPESRTFLCPLCKECCNCSNCIRKRNLAHLLDGKNGLSHLKSQIRKARARPVSGEGDQDAQHGEDQGGKKGMTIQDILSQAVKDKVGVPFDRVRIVFQEEDVVTPELPPLPVPNAVKVKKAGPGKGKGKMKVKKNKDQAVTGEDAGKGPATEASSTGVAQSSNKVSKKKKGSGKGKSAGNGDGTRASPALPTLDGEIPIDPILLTEMATAHAATSPPRPLRVKLKIPKLDQQSPANVTGLHNDQSIQKDGKKREKYVDSDGDTIAGSDSDFGNGDIEEVEGEEDSALTALSDDLDGDMDVDYGRAPDDGYSRAAGIPLKSAHREKRLPGREAATNDYLASISGRTPTDVFGVSSRGVDHERPVGRIGYSGDDEGDMAQSDGVVSPTLLGPGAYFDSDPTLLVPSASLRDPNGQSDSGGNPHLGMLWNSPYRRTHHYAHLQASTFMNTHIQDRQHSVHDSLPPWQTSMAVSDFNPTVDTTYIHEQPYPNMYGSSQGLVPQVDQYMPQQPENPIQVGEDGPESGVGVVGTKAYPDASRHTFRPDEQYAGDPGHRHLVSPPFGTTGDTYLYGGSMGLAAGHASASTMHHNQNPHGMSGQGLPPPYSHSPPRRHPHLPGQSF